MPHRPKSKKLGPKKSRRLSLLPPGRYTMWVGHLPRGSGPSNSTTTGRPYAPAAKGKFAVEIVEKLPRRGKPPLPNRIRQDEIVGYVHFLQKANPTAKMDEAIIKDVAKFFHVAEKTVWNALARHRRLDPDKPIPAGPITFWLHETD